MFSDCAKCVENVKVRWKNSSSVVIDLRTHLKKHHEKHHASLTVKAKVFGEGLGAEHFKAHGDKVAHRPGILLQAAWSKSLISGVKEHKQLPPLEKKRMKDQTIWRRLNHVLFKQTLVFLLRENCTIITSAICFHCSGVGSVPVGLWAHACRTKMERSGQLCGRRRGEEEEGR